MYPHQFKILQIPDGLENFYTSLRKAETTTKENSLRNLAHRPTLE